ncbi:hypothetical protein SEUCBS139899_007504 [Sporothrix eucalyptigena]|uniref:Transcription factor CBF/NF-Y/archaeal histone domain-containing protein n=1 Tax=Sporothrix eucalyptigena TaxID=1812306 RepID=A0ABP0CBG0_9PEZI
MPYNTTAIPPRKEPTGQTQLPLSRVRKIVALDPDVAVCSSNAAFVVTLATELFIQYLSSEAQNMVKLDRKPRRNVQYRDLANAINRVDRLEFLEDTVPVTVPFGKIKRDAAAAQAKLRSGGAVGGDAPAGNSGSGGGKSRVSKGGESAPSGGVARSKAGRSSNGPPPTAISALMANGDGATNGSSGGKKRQQVLSFNILNGEEDDDEGKGKNSLTFRSAPSSGVAAAAALAQAAAASGAAALALDDADPDAQLEQDMQRAREDGPPTSTNSRRDGSARFTVANDVDMLDN